MKKCYYHVYVHHQKNGQKKVLNLWFNINVLYSYLKNFPIHIIVHHISRINELFDIVPHISRISELLHEFEKHKQFIIEETLIQIQTQLPKNLQQWMLRYIY